MNKKIVARLGVSLSLVAAFGLGAVVVAAVRPAGLSAGEARRLIARMPGFQLSNDSVRVKSVSALGTSAVVVAQVETAYRFEQDTNGKWRVAEVRTGADRWQSVDELARSLTEEKISVAHAEMETIATALEAFRRARGAYVQADNIAVLMDHLQPHYLCRVIRVDPWHRPYAYSVAGNNFTLSSNGPDGQPGTADDIAYAK